MKIGYARVSKLDQNLDRQLDQLKKEGCERIYQEKITGTRKDRPELIRMMDAVREGDTIIVCEDRQLDQLKKEGCERIYQEKITGTRKDRPELIRMMDAVREGDTIIVCELTRLSRSVKDLFELVEKINSAKANIRSLKEPWLDTTTAQGRLLFSIFSGVSQFERDLIRERTLEGISSARARGRMGGRPKTDPKIIKTALE